MKSTGVVRKVDDLGRVFIPIELRRTLDIDLNDPMEIFVEDDRIILQKFNSEMACTLTGEVTKENKVFADGKLALSPEGVKLLVKEIETHFAIRV